MKYAEQKRKERRKKPKNESTYTITLFFSSMETLPKYVEILCWNLCFENNQQREVGDYCYLFRCRIVMMIKSQLKDNTKQRHAGNWRQSVCQVSSLPLHCVP